MLRFLATAVKAAGLTYSFLSTATLIGFLAAGVYQHVKKK